MKPTWPGLYVVAGNHDDYDFAPQTSCYLGDFGTLPFTEEVFFVRGADSIDKQDRVEGVSWWRNEELTQKQGYEALEAYAKAKPYAVLSHDCPQSVANDVWRLPPSRTRQLLQTMFETHQPEKWFFGHHHNRMRLQVDRTEFRCLGINEIVELCLEEK